MKESFIKEQTQYWYSKWCNSIMKDEKLVYWDLYKSYQNLYDYYKSHNMF